MMQRIRKFLYNIRQNLYFRRNSKKLFSLIDEALKEKGLFYWLEYGTLLGAMREHDFIKHDTDMDFGMMYSDHEYVPTAMVVKGIKLFAQEFVESRSALIQKYIYKGIIFDVYFYEISEDNDTRTCYSFYNIGKYRRSDKKRERGVKKLTYPHSGFEKTVFLGRNVNIPANTDTYLRLLYGDNYMNPDPKFEYEKNPNATLYRTMYRPDELKGIWIKEE